MNAAQFSHALGKVNDKYIMEAITYERKKKSGWLKWGAMAACLCLIIGGFAIHQLGMSGAPTGTTGENDHAHNSVVYGFSLDENGTAWYFPISFEEYVRYKLVPNDGIDLSESYIYQITDDDLGNLMGTVTDCEDKTIIGSQVYHFAKYPEYDSICIVDAPNGYALYVCNWLDVPVEIGDVSDAVLSAYGLPNSFETMEILSPDSQYLFCIDDETTTKAILGLFSGKVNHGLEANERLFAQAWHDAYGNDDIHYSEESGTCVAKEISLFDKAHELWSEGERIIQITTNRGFRLTIDYFPAVRVFACGDGYYEFSVNEVESLNSLLQYSAEQKEQRPNKDSAPASYPDTAIVPGFGLDELAESAEP